MSLVAVQVLAFNYPGQADTTFAPSCLPTNEWVAERLHELLRHVEGCGHMLLSSSPFHILAIGNGAAIATAFIHKYATRPHCQAYAPHMLAMYGCPLCSFVLNHPCSAHLNGFCRYGASPSYADSLRSLVCVNGYSHADGQLSAILHSSINVFSSLPDNRPDLPVSYFSRFLFSEASPTHHTCHSSVHPSSHPALFHLHPILTFVPFAWCCRTT